MLYDLGSDLKTSRYFQIHFLLACLFGLIAVAGVINLIPITVTETNYGLWRVFNQPVDSIQWPDFIVASINKQAISMKCNMVDGKQVKVDHIDDANSAVKIQASDFKAETTGSSDSHSLITCVMGQGNNPTSWQILSHPRNSPAVTFVQYDQAEISLHKSVYNYKVNKYHKDPVVEDWGPIVTYRNNNADQPTIYLSISNFVVHNYQEVEYYDDWECYADVGGLIFMSYLFHKIVMFFVAIGVPNNSRVLGGADASPRPTASNYEPIPERGQI